eukprot:6202828-Pleurochrysis_carterae.AAC.3
MSASTIEHRLATCISKSQSLCKYLQYPDGAADVHSVLVQLAEQAAEIYAKQSASPKLQRAIACRLEY